MTDTLTTTRKDWVSNQEVRWCPGCGDYGILMAVQMAMTELGSDPDNTAFISGIGCAARFPYYMNTYGMHSIHGRAPAIASGLALSQPDLNVWVVGGDGDMLSIGGNHLIHAMRRNIDLTILLFNNRIYGLTKGQYSPTSEEGKITKSSPMGSIDHPFNPISLVLGADSSFVARTHDMDRRHMIDTFKLAHDHKGSSVVEIFQNCNVFNNGAYGEVTSKDRREEMIIDLHDGEPIRFGHEGSHGVIVDHGVAKIVETADVGVDALTVHHHDNPDPSVAFALSRLASKPDAPTPMGVFRSIERPVYGDVMEAQVTKAKADKGDGDIDALLHSLPTWEVD